MIEVRAVGGYGEVGRNMVAIRVDNEVIICDMGVHLENYISLTEDEDVVNIPTEVLIAKQAVPDISLIEEWSTMVKAIVPTHAHLDHVGALPALAGLYDAPIVCTPFTAAVLQRIVEDARISWHTEIKRIPVNSKLKISDAITIELVAITHSTPHTAMVVIHTPYGKVVYANDFKFDMEPIVGTKPNIKRMQELGKEGDVRCLIVDSLYAHDKRKMPSEKVARAMLKDVLLGTASEGKAIIATTFSSHIARLKSMVEYGKRLNRNIIFMGRSLAKYVSAAEEVGLVDFSKDVEILKYSSKAGSRLKHIMKEGREKYLIVVTGHQGEPQSILSKMTHGLFEFKKGDHVIFSTSIIPTPTNQRNREEVEHILSKHGVRIFKDIHVSGHAAREDHRDLLEMLKPAHIIPAHSELPRMTAMLDLAMELGYGAEQVHLMKNGSTVRVD